MITFFVCLFAIALLVVILVNSVGDSLRNKRFERVMIVQDEAHDAYDRTYKELSKLRSVSEEYRINKAIDAEEAVYKKYEANS